MHFENSEDVVYFNLQNCFFFVYYSERLLVYHPTASVIGASVFNLLAPELFFLILAHLYIKCE